jgi:hypothetical protein
VCLTPLLSGLCAVLILAGSSNPCPARLAVPFATVPAGEIAQDIGKTIHLHPTLGESIGMAAEVAHGSCTDLPPSKK